MNAGAAQVAFSPHGQWLVVTERLTNRILTYAVDHGGRAGQPKVFASSGAVPFGFGFARSRRIVVSETGQRAVSSYALEADGDLRVISGSVATDQAAACWIAISHDQRYAYTTNAGSASITGYRIQAAGGLTRLNPSGPTATTGAQPLDMALSRHGHYLYVLQGGAHQVSGFRLQPDGSLTPINSAGSLPVGTVGLAAF